MANQHGDTPHRQKECFPSVWSLSHLGQEDASRTSCDGGCGLLSMQKHSHLERQIIVCQQEGFPSVEDVPAQFTVSTIWEIYYLCPARAT